MRESTSPPHILKWATPLVQLGLSGRNSGRIPERSRKRSQSVFLEFPLKVRLGCPKPYNSRHLRLPEHFQNSLPPSTAWAASFFSEAVPETASQSRCRGIPGSTVGSAETDPVRFRWGFGEGLLKDFWRISDVFWLLPTPFPKTPFGRYRVFLIEVKHEDPRRPRKTCTSAACVL